MAAYAALVSVMHIINNLQLHPRPPISLLQKQVDSLTEKVRFLQEFLEGYNSHLGYTVEADPLEIRIADAAYAAEDAIESHIVYRITGVGENSSYGSLCQVVEQVTAEMTLIGKEVMKIKEEAMEIKETAGVQEDLLPRKSKPLDPSGSSSPTGQKSSMVGVDDVLFQLKDKLTSHCSDLQILAIVGMGGTGKTTLTMNVYQDRFVNERFDICAWITFTQEYNIGEILSDVLRKLNISVGPHLSEFMIGEMLYKHLYGRKYLVIMDDMWSIEAWFGVGRFFPDNKNGSRIVVTTRLSNLASQLPSSISLEMKLLDETHSWNLLSKAVFGLKGCPLELEGVGKKVGKSCKGLPLSIVVVGGLLAKSVRSIEFWDYIAVNLNSIVNSVDDERCLKILHMSYKQLPVCLKPCFLYMGVFPEDKVIRVARLIKLWVAEGFIKLQRGKILEETARDYLNDLIDRNLILIHGLGSTGNIKCCKMHDLLRDLCLREAQRERFFSVITRLPTSQGQGIVNTQRRIVISKNAAINALSTSLPRSLIWDLQQILPPLSFRLLRILDSCRSIPIASTAFLEGMHQLVNLRFLAIAAECEFPRSVWLFWNLQTLIVGRLWGFTAPNDIWSMPHIRHIKFLRLCLPDPPSCQDNIVLGSLQSLGRIKNFKCSEQVIRRIPNIRKLQICYDKGLDDSYCLTNLDRLDKLESLNCAFSPVTNRIGHDYLQRLINFPQSLKKLTLVIDKSQCWKDMLDKIGALPLLQKLALYGGCFTEGQWETTEGHFCSLKFLLLRRCDSMQQWTTDSSHFPCLDHLVLDRIHELKEIPLDFAEMSTLRMVDVVYCSNSVIFSAKNVLELQEELYGETTFKVTLKTTDKALQRLTSHNFHVTCD